MSPKTASEFEQGRILAGGKQRRQRIDVSMDTFVRDIRGEGAEPTVAVGSMHYALA